MKTPFFRVVSSIIRKDLQAELRSRELINSMGLFALLSILIFSFALELDRQARVESISGVLWVTIVFASILGLNRSMYTEREHNSMDAILLAPVDRAAIFAGKFAGNLLFTLVVAVALLPVMTVLYNVNLFSPWLLLVVLTGTIGISAAGTLLAAMTVQTRARETLLPIVMLPVILPVLLAAVRASTAITRDAPAADWSGWIQILLIVDLIYIVLGFLTFRYVIEE